MFTSFVHLNHFVVFWPFLFLAFFVVSGLGFPRSFFQHFCIYDLFQIIFYFYYARYKPQNMPLSFWTALKVIKNFGTCLLIFYGAVSQFMVLSREHTNRKSKQNSTKSFKDKIVRISDYIIFFIFIMSIIAFEVTYNILMVFSQLSTQVEAALIGNTENTERNW